MAQLLQAFRQRRKDYVATVDVDIGRRCGPRGIWGRKTRVIWSSGWTTWGGWTRRPCGGGCAGPKWLGSGGSCISGWRSRRSADRRFLAWPSAIQESLGGAILGRFYYAMQRRRSEWVVGDLRPGTGAGLVFGRNRRGSIAPRMPAGDSRRLGYRSSGGESCPARRGVALRGSGVEWNATRGLDAPGWALGRTGAGAVSAREWLSRDRDRGGWPRPAGHPGWRRPAALAGRALAVGHDPAGLGLFSPYIDLRRNGRTPWGFVGDEQRVGAVDVRVEWDQGPSGVGDGWRWGGALGDGRGTARAVWGSADADAGPLLCAGIPQLLWRGSGDFGHAERTEVA